MRAPVIFPHPHFLFWLLHFYYFSVIYNLLTIIIAILVGMKWYLIVTLIFISLMANDNIFSCSSWSVIYLLWRNMISIPLPTFWLGCLSFCCWIVRVLYLFRILDPYQIYDLQVFSLVLQPSFYFLEVPLKYKVLSFDKF